MTRKCNSLVASSGFFSMRFATNFTQLIAVQKYLNCSCLFSRRFSSLLRFVLHSVTAHEPNLLVLGKLEIAYKNI